MNHSVVIPLGRGSRWNDTELRFCLRSIEKHLSNYGDIFLIGEKPDWVQNIIHIPIEESGLNYHKEMNIFNKIMAALYDPRVTDEFYFTNDDHFLLTNYFADSFPYYYSGLLSEQENRIDMYGNTVRQTLQYLGDHYALTPFPNFDTHCPIRYTKTDFIKLKVAGWSIPWSYCIKTMYCVNSGITGEYCPDLKINEPVTEEMIWKKLENRFFFSIGDIARGDALRSVLLKLYPSKSKYEK